MEYLSRLRVERAAAYLRAGGWSTQQIAEMVGIPNYRTFFNVSRRVMGTSPSEFASRFEQV